MPEINEAFESWFEERKYIAVSIKHSTRDSFMYWGILTKDNEPRCYSGYTYEFDKCEIYSREEMKYFPVVSGIKSIAQFWKKNKNIYTVLVDINEWKHLMEKEIENQRKRREKKGANVLRKGEKVVMHSCAEASHYDGQIWECETDSYDYYGTELVLLKGFSGTFWTQYLQRVKV